MVYLFKPTTLPFPMYWQRAQHPRPLVDLWKQSHGHGYNWFQYVQITRAIGIDLSVHEPANAVPCTSLSVLGRILKYIYVYVEAVWVGVVIFLSVCCGDHDRCNRVGFAWTSTTMPRGVPLGKCMGIELMIQNWLTCHCIINNSDTSSYPDFIRSPGISWKVILSASNTSVS